MEPWHCYGAGIWDEVLTAQEVLWNELKHRTLFRNEQARVYLILYMDVKYFRGYI